MVEEKKGSYFPGKKIVIYFAFLLAAAQIVTGLIWILCNITEGCESEASGRFVAAAQSGVMDEYIGVLYPLLIKLAMIAAGVFGWAYEPFVYLVQLVTAVLCATAFGKLCSREADDPGETGVAGDGFSICSRLAMVGEKLHPVYFGLLLVTIPLCVQWHLTILPNSLAASLFLLLLGLVIHIYRFRGYAQWQQVTRLGLVWALLVLLMPDYLWLAMLPVLFTIVGVLRSVPGRKKWFVVAVPFLIVFLAAGINQLVQQPGSGGRIQRSVEASMVSRFVWPHFGTNYFFWPDEIKEIMTPEEGAQISRYADNVQLVFGPLVEGHYGREKANDYYLQMAMSCLEYRTKDVAAAIAEDWAAYCNPLWMVKEQLDGCGLSYTGYHYQNMREHSPLLTKWYVHYGLIGFRVMLLLAGICLLGRLVAFCWKKPQAGHSSMTVVCLCIACVLLHAAWYTMAGAGMMDYGNVCVVQMLWYCGIWGIVGK